MGVEEIILTYPSAPSPATGLPIAPHFPTRLTQRRKTFHPDQETSGRNLVAVTDPRRARSRVNKRPAAAGRFGPDVFCGSPVFNGKPERRGQGTTQTWSHEDSGTGSGLKP